MSYAAMPAADTKILRAAVDQQDSLFKHRHAEDTTFTLWTRYQLRGEWERWSVGSRDEGGERLLCERRCNALVADAYATVNEIGYRFSDKLSATLTVTTCSSLRLRRQGELGVQKITSTVNRAA